MKIHFVRHVFVTLTYRRELDCNITWSRVPKDYNRWVQRMRRKHRCRIEYFRSVEKHQDGYPHIHCLIQFPDARIKVHNLEYFDVILYRKWKDWWPHGLSDFQVPKSKAVGQLTYIMKYITKNSTVKTVWKKIYALNVDKVTTTSKEATDVSAGEESKNSTVAVTNTISSSTTLLTSKRSTLQHCGIKLLTWSRSFDFSVFKLIKKIEPCPNRVLFTQKRS